MDAIGGKGLVGCVGEILGFQAQAHEALDGPVIGIAEAVARDALKRDRSSAIVLGCTGMAPLCRTRSQGLGVAVIDRVAVAVKWGEALANLGLRTNKAGGYAQPLPKTYTGWAQPFGW